MKRFEAVVKIIGLGESEVVNKIKTIKLNNVELNYRIFFPEIHLTLFSTIINKARAKETILDAVEDIKNVLGINVFSVNGEDLEKVVSDLLISNNLTIATAESCTGGLLSNLLTDIPGSSAYFKNGIVAYSNDAKHEFLHVPENLIIKNGAVSKEVVEAMASSVREISNTDIGVGISGIAGPGGGTVEKPVGTVYMAIDTKTGGVSSQRFSFDGTRKEIKMLSAKYALDLIRKSMINIYNGGKNG